MMKMNQKLVIMVERPEKFRIEKIMVKYLSVPKTVLRSRISP